MICAARQISASTSIWKRTGRCPSTTLHAPGKRDTEFFLNWFSGCRHGFWRCLTQAEDQAYLLVLLTDVECSMTALPLSCLADQNAEAGHTPARRLQAGSHFLTRIRLAQICPTG